MSTSETPRRKILAAVVVVALAAGAGVWWWRVHGEPADGALVLQGNVEIRQVNLGFKVAGRIEKLFVDEGVTVRPGEKLGSLEKIYAEDAVKQARAQRDQAAATLAKLEAGNRPEEIAQAEAAVAEREAAVANARVALERAQRLLKSSAGTQKAYDDAMAADRQTRAQLASARAALQLMKAGSRKEDIEVARAQLADRNAALQVAERQLSDTDLVAPSPGVILSRVREVGAIVNPGETVFVQSLTTPVWVRTYVSEPDLGRIRPGQKVELAYDLPGSRPLTGHVGFISSTAEFTPKTVETRELRTALVYRVRIVAEDPKGVLRQGMPITVTLLPGGGEAKVSQARSGEKAR